MFDKFKIPDWYNEWNEKNPVDIEGPAIRLGIVGGVVVFVAIVASFGNPLSQISMQTGPRGTGMSIPEYTADLAEPDPGIAEYLPRSAITEAETGAVSAAALANVPPALEGIAEADYAELVVAMRSWTGIPDLMEDPEHYQTQVAYNMVEMVQNLNDIWGGHTYANGEVGVTCYTCHRGQAVPSDIWFRIAPVTETTSGWAAVQNRATIQSQYTSLPSDALEEYLLNGEQIVVHNLESRVEEWPYEDGVSTWQDTERTFSLMNYFSNSLGKNCLLCHNSRAFYAAAGEVTPQWATASLGIQMVLEMNNDYLEPLGELYPEDRLGPVYADAPKAACRTCHKGYQQPLQGLNVIGDWPELATLQ